MPNWVIEMESELKTIPGLKKMLEKYLAEQKKKGREGGRKKRSGGELACEQASAVTALTHAEHKS